LAYTVQEVTAAVKGAAAGVREVSYASANANAATAGKVTQVVARLDDVGGVTIEESMTATADRVAGLAGEYMVKINAGHAVAGFGLAASEDPTGATTSSFIVQANDFAVVSPYTFASVAASTPSAGAIGDTWYQTDTKISKRATATGTGSWVTFTPKVPFGVDTISDYVYLDGGIRVKGTILGGAATDYSTGTGFFAGYVDSTYKWRVGDNTKFITWDGTDVTIAGGVKIGSSLTLAEIATIGLTTTIDIYSVGLSATPTSTTATYTITGDAFSTGNLTAGWSRTQPASSTTATYKSSATVTATAPGTAVTIGTWSAPIVVAQNGAGGSNGTNGTNSTVPGPRGNVNLTSTGYTAWSSSAATSLVGIYTGGGSNMMMDIVTLYGTGFSETRYWTGAAWVQLTAYIHGNLLVDGTITAGTGTFNKVIFSPTTTATYSGGTAVTATSGQVDVVVTLASSIGTPVFCWSCDAGAGRSSSLVCISNTTTTVTFRLCVWDSATGTGYSGSVSTLKIWIF
jgi:hypothetical protein